MTVLFEHWLGFTLIVLYSVVLLYHANVGRRRSSDLDGYLVGGRDMSGLAIGVSFFATFASTNSYIGHAGKGYAYGVAWLLFALVIVLFTFVSWRLVAPRLRTYSRGWGSVTLADYLETRFASRGVRRAAAVVIVASSLLYLLAIFKGAGNLFEEILQIPYPAAVGLTLVIVVVYTSIGGFVSVVRTDVIQGALMLVGSMTIFYHVTRAAGGVDAVFALAEVPSTAYLFDWNGGVPLAVLLGIAFAGSLKLLVDPRQLSRFYALRDASGVRSGVWFALVGLLVIQLCLFPVGIYAHLLLDNVTDTDRIVPQLLTQVEVFPVWVADFLIVAILAAAMSSIDSVLIVCAGTFTNDIVSAYTGRPASVTTTRAAVVGSAVLAALLALDPPGGIVEITVFSGSLYAVCFFPAVVLGLHWRRGNGLAVLASMGVGVAVLLIWMGMGFQEFLHEVFPALGASVLTYVIVARRAPPAIDVFPTDEGAG